MGLDRLESANVTFKHWHQLGKTLIQPGKLDIAKRLYSIMIQKEKALECAIDKTENINEKRRLGQLKRTMRCDLGSARAIVMLCW